MPSKPFDPYALKDATEQLEGQQQRMEKYLESRIKKPKKRGLLRRLFGWFV